MKKWATIRYIYYEKTRNEIKLELQKSGRVLLKYDEGYFFYLIKSNMSYTTRPRMDTFSGLNCILHNEDGLAFSIGVWAGYRYYGCKVDTLSELLSPIKRKHIEIKEFL